MRHKKLFLIPISIALVVVLVAGGALAAWLWNKQLPATVQILGAGVEVYQTIACTEPLTSLTFPALHEGSQSAPTSAFIKNVGEDVVALSSAIGSDLHPLLTAYMNSVAQTEVEAALSVWIRTGVGAITLTTAITAEEVTSLEVSSDAVLLTAGGFVKMDNEIIQYDSRVGLVLNGLTRGIASTVAVEHAIGAPIIRYDLAVDNLLPVGKVGEVVMYLVADADPDQSQLQRGEEEFTVIFNGTLPE